MSRKLDRDQLRSLMGGLTGFLLAGAFAISFAAVTNTIQVGEAPVYWAGDRSQPDGIVPCSLYRLNHNELDLADRSLPCQQCKPLPSRWLAN